MEQKINKLIKCIKSCKTKTQLDNTKNWIDKIIFDRNYYTILTDYIREQKQKINIYA